MNQAAHRVTLRGADTRLFDLDALDMGVVMMRQFAGAPIAVRDLQEAEAHQVGAQGNAEIDEPARDLEIGRDLVGVHQSDHEFRAHGADYGGEERAAEQAEQHHRIAPGRFELVHHHVDADMDAGAHAIGRTELGHPHEHVDAQFLRPGQVDGKQNGIQQWNADEIAVHHRDKDDRRRQRHQRRDQYLLKPIEDPKQHQCSPTSQPFVMPGLVPDIHVLITLDAKGVDGRVILREDALHALPGHDEACPFATRCKARCISNCTFSWSRPSSP